MLPIISTAASMIEGIKDYKFGERHDLIHSYHASIRYEDDIIATSMEDAAMTSINAMPDYDVQLTDFCGEIYVVEVELTGGSYDSGDFTETHIQDKHFHYSPEYVRFVLSDSEYQIQFTPGVKFQCRMIDPEIKCPKCDGTDDTCLACGGGGVIDAGSEARADKIYVELKDWKDQQRSKDVSGK